MTGREVVDAVIDARSLARILADAARFTLTGKDFAGTSASAVELTVSDGIAHACATTGGAAAWSRARCEFGDGPARAVLDIADVKKVVHAIIPRRTQGVDENDHFIQLSFRENLAVSMYRVDDATEPDWSIDVRPSPVADLFNQDGEIAFPNIPHMIKSPGPAVNTDSGEWAVLAQWIVLFGQVSSAHEAPISAQMCAPRVPGTARRLIRIRVGELFTGAVLTAVPPERIDPDVPPEEPVAVRASATEETYRRPPTSGGLL